MLSPEDIHIIHRLEEPSYISKMRNMFLNYMSEDDVDFIFSIRDEYHKKLLAGDPDALKVHAMSDEFFNNSSAKKKEPQE